MTKGKSGEQSLIKHDTWQNQGPNMPRIQGQHTTPHTCVDSAPPLGGCDLEPCHQDNKEP